MEYILRHLRIREPGKVVMYGEYLAQGLVDRLSQGTVQMRLPAEYEGEAV